MQNFPFNRELLNRRHRLSHQQIDDLLKEKYSKEHLPEKFGQLFQVGEFIKLSDAFREATIPFIPLKGPILSHRLYNDACFRYYTDLDFLIPLNSIKEAIRILETSGYKAYSLDWPTNLKKERTFIKRKNQIVYVHPEKQLTIEIHWKLLPFEITNSNTLSEVLKSNGYQIRFQERNFQGFNNELELLYLIIHGGLHAWFRLKWLIDVKDFIEKIPIDTEKFTQLVVQFNATRMVSLCNALLTEYFPECPLLPCKPIQGIRRRLKYTISQIENELEGNHSLRERIEFHWFRIHSFPGLKYKLSVIANVLFRQGKPHSFLKKIT